MQCKYCRHYNIGIIREIDSYGKRESQPFDNYCRPVSQHRNRKLESEKGEIKMRYKEYQFRRL